MSNSRILPHLTVSGVVPELPPGQLERVIAGVLAGEGRSAEISLTFLDAADMARLNAETFGHPDATDVISFALPQPDGTLLGDIYLCEEVARRNAAEYENRAECEVLRLVVHGVLHVLGWDHPDGPERTSSPMWETQEHYLRLIS